MTAQQSLFPDGPPKCEGKATEIRKPCSCTACTTRRQMASV